MMAHRTIETYRRIVQEHIAANNIPCQKCGVKLWLHVEELAGHRFVNGARA
jgi:hypothetical protein